MTADCLPLVARCCYCCVNTPPTKYSYSSFQRQNNISATRTMIGVVFCYLVILLHLHLQHFCGINPSHNQPPTFIFRIFRPFPSSTLFCFHTLASFFLFLNLNTHLQSILGVQVSEDGCLVWGVTQAISLVDSQTSPQHKSDFYIPSFISL